MSPAAAISRACLQAYVDKDRDAAEALIADDFRFTSPLDNALDRKTYFERCWPNSKSMESFEIVEECGVRCHRRPCLSVVCGRSRPAAGV